MVTVRTLNILDYEKGVRIDCYYGKKKMRRDKSKHNHYFSSYYWRQTNLLYKGQIRYTSHSLTHTFLPYFVLGNMEGKILPVLAVI